MRNFFLSFASSVIFSTTLLAGTVDDAQRMLNQLGYSAGAVDGAYGRKTKSALEKFYSSIGSEYDGILDANEIADLKSEMSKYRRQQNALFLPTLGIDTRSSDTTLRGFRDTEDERFRNHHKKEMQQYEKEKGITLFGVVDDDTRYGETAFYVQAPSDGCYNRKAHDCNRQTGERQKRVEANYGSFKGGEHWFSISIKLDEWALNRYGMTVTQFHSDVPQYQPMLLLRINNKWGMALEHLSANGFQFVEGGSEECAAGAASKKTEDKMYCPKLHDIYQILKPSEVKVGEWYDFVYHVNFDKDEPTSEFVKIWLNGKLVVNNAGQNKTLWWKTMPGVEEWENRVKFNFGIYGTSKDNAYHSAYFDEVTKAPSCEELMLERLGYNCASLTKQNYITQPRWHDSPDL